MDLIDILPYRLSELYDTAKRRALFSDLADHFGHPVMRDFLAAVDAAISTTDEDQQSEIDDLKAEIEELQEDLEAERAANNELRYDVNYYQQEAEKWQDRLESQN